MRWPILALTVAMGSAGAAAAQSPQDLMDQIIPPDMVLAEAQALGLSPAQRQAVQGVQFELQPKMMPLVRRIREERDALVALLKKEKPDEAAVLAQFEKLNAVETELKRVRFQMTVGVKRILSGEQQAKAMALHETRLATTGAAAGPNSLAAKLQRVKEGLNQWKSEGRDVTPLRELWDRFRAAEDKGHYRQARQALDEAIALLDKPPPKP